MKNRTTKNSIIGQASLAIIIILGVGGYISYKSVANAKPQFTKPAPIPLELKGRFIQSGAIIGKTTPNATVIFGEIAKDPISFNADKDGNFVLGIDRDAGADFILKIKTDDNEISKSLKIYPRTYKETVVNGLPAAKLNPPESAQTQIAAERIIKDKAWASLDSDERGFLETFRWPVDKVRITSPWGAVRRLNGQLQRPHYGVDVGAPNGTPLYAPASGKVVIAENDLFYEGGLVGIDHGQGLISYSMHMSKVSVTTGQRVNKGDLIGAVGSTGRSTGPHLHWSLRWRGQQLDPELMTHPLMEYQEPLKK